MAERAPIWEGKENSNVGRFPRSLGLMPEQVTPGHVIVHLHEPAETLRNSHDAVNGGVIATMFDWAMGMAIATGVNAENGGQRISQATVSLDISYQRAALGANFRAIGRLTHYGSTLAFAEGTIEDERGNVCATAHGVWRLLRPRSAGPAPDDGNK